MPSPLVYEVVAHELSGDPELIGIVSQRGFVATAGDTNLVYFVRFDWALLNIL